MCTFNNVYNRISLCFSADHSLHPELPQYLRQEGSGVGLPQVVQRQPGPPVPGTRPQGPQTCCLYTSSCYACAYGTRWSLVTQTESPASVAEERYLLLPGVGLVPGADQEPRSEAALQAHHQPAGWLQHVQAAAAGGAVTPTHTDARCQDRLSTSRYLANLICPDYLWSVYHRATQWLGGYSNKVAGSILGLAPTRVPEFSPGSSNITGTCFFGFYFEF